jgi:hypothetical protein
MPSKNNHDKTLNILLKFKQRPLMAGIIIAKHVLNKITLYEAIATGDSAVARKGIRHDSANGKKRP